MSQLLRFFLSFCMFYAVDPEGAGGGEVDLGGEEDDEDDQPVEDAGEEAWKAIQGEGSEEGGEEAPAEESVELPGEEAKPEGDGATAEEAAAAKEKADNAAITEDDLKPLEGAKAKTQERFQKVTEGYKAEKERADKLTEEVGRYKQSFDSLRQLGFTDEAAATDLVEFSAYRNVLASGDADQFQAIINAQVKQFQDLHGKAIQVNGSILSDHADLQAKVESLELDESTAIEVARARNLQQRASREAQQQTQASNEAARSQQAIQEGANAVSQLEQQWRNSDTDFPVILPLLQEQITEIARTLPPNQWVTQVKLQYQAIKKALASAGSQQRQPSSLRGGSHLSATRQPASMQEAVLQEMGME